MISPSEIFLGIVALKQINPHEQILLDYSGVVPNARNSHLSVLKICKCLNCCPIGSSLTRPTRSRKKLTINDSLAKWNEAGRCPDIGAISSSQSSESDNSRIPIPLEPLTSLSHPRKKLTIYDGLEEWNEVGMFPNTGTISSSQSSKSANSGILLPLAPSLAQSSPNNALPSPLDSALATATPLLLKNSTRSKKKSFKNDSNKLLTFRDIHENKANPINEFGGLEDSCSSSSYPKTSKPCSGSRSRLIAFKGHNGRSVLENSTLLIPLRGLISSGAARRITSDQIAPIFHLIIQFTVRTTKAKGNAANKDLMTLEPFHFKWKTNPIKCGSSLLIGAITSLQGDEIILKEGTLESLSRKFNVPELGNLVFQLLKQSTLFKPRDDCDPPRGDHPPRDLLVFPALDEFSTPPSKPTDNHHMVENIDSAGSLFSSPVSSLSMASTNDASARFLSAIKDPSKRLNSQIKDLVKAQVASELQALLKSLNPTLTINSSVKNDNHSDDDKFVGRGPKTCPCNLPPNLESRGYSCGPSHESLDEDTRLRIKINNCKARIIRCKEKDWIGIKCGYCPEGLERCWLCIDDHIDICSTCRILEAQALQDLALLEDHQSTLRDLKIESDIARESNDHLISDLKSMKDYLNSFPPIPDDLSLYSTVIKPCSMENLDNTRSLPQDSQIDLFTGRGSYPVPPPSDIEEVFITQLDSRSNPTKISPIIPECVALFDSISNNEEGYNISYLSHKAVKAVQNSSPHHPKSYKQALLGEFGGSGPRRGPPDTDTNSILKSQSISVTTQKMQSITITILDSTVTYSVQFIPHESRQSVVLIDGHPQSK